MYGISTLTTKGQVTIPQDMRLMLGIQSGDLVYFEADRRLKVVNLKKARSKSIVDKLYGSLKSNKPYVDYHTVRQKAGELLAKKYGLKKR